MSETVKIPLENVENWLKSETSQVFQPIHDKAEKLFREMKDALDYLKDTSRTLFENSKREIAKRNMKTYRRARAMNKLAKVFIERFSHVNIPDEISYESLYDFSQEVQKVFAVTDIDIRRWFPRISPYFILDRRKFLAVFETAKRTWRSFNDFIAKEYVKTKTLEDTFQLLEKISELKKERSEIERERQKLKEEIVSLERRIVEVEQKIAYLKERDVMSKLNDTRGEIENLKVRVKERLRKLRKPFIKLQSLALHGSGSGLTPEEINKLNQYIEEPFQALATEELNYPLLKQILKKLEKLISEEKIKLKRDRKRKAEESIKKIVYENSLKNLQEKCVETLNLMKKLSTSTRIGEIRGEMKKLKKELKELERRRNRVKSEEVSLKKGYEEILEKIEDEKRRVEENVFSFLNKRISVE